MECHLGVVHSGGVGLVEHNEAGRRGDEELQERRSVRGRVARWG
jgi:hypothetical protein